MTNQLTVADKFLRVNGLRIHYVDWGNPDAQPMIMLHGLMSYAHVWDGVAREISHRYHILALDQRGRGDSDWAIDGNYSTEAYVSDVEEFADQLALEPFVLFGHSMGGTNSIVYASRHPDKVSALVIEDTGPRSSNPDAGAAGRRIREELENTPRLFASLAEAEAFWRSQRSTNQDWAVKARLENALKELPDGRVTWKYDIEGIAKAFINQMSPVATTPRVDLWPHVRSIQCPTLVIRGGVSDGLSRETAQEMAGANPNIRWVEIPGATHTVHEDNLEAFNSEVSKFLVGGTRD